ncbi:hypothetical protein C8J56DRAFT_1128600 [Mycena floridula]|nr:hypothetical protein C8J56DRAFT_1128600 [Mycena floridula]
MTKTLAPFSEKFEQDFIEKHGKAPPALIPDSRFYGDEKNPKSAISATTTTTTRIVQGYQHVYSTTAFTIGFAMVRKQLGLQRASELSGGDCIAFDLNVETVTSIPARLLMWNGEHAAAVFPEDMVVDSSARTAFKLKPYSIWLGMSVQWELDRNGVYWSRPRDTRSGILGDRKRFCEQSRSRFSDLSTRGNLRDAVVKVLFRTWDLIGDMGLLRTGTLSYGPSRDVQISYNIAAPEKTQYCLNNFFDEISLWVSTSVARRAQWKQGHESCFLELTSRWRTNFLARSSLWIFSHRRVESLFRNMALVLKPSFGCPAPNYQLPTPSYRFFPPSSVDTMRASPIAVIPTTYGLLEVVVPSEAVKLGRRRWIFLATEGTKAVAQPQLATSFGTLGLVTPSKDVKLGRR